MKFSDGYWLMREGVTAGYPAGVLDVETGPGSLTVHAPTHPVRHRGDLLKGPALTLTCTAPMPGVIGVRLTHFAGGADRGPSFELTEEDGATEVFCDEDEARLTSGALTLTIARTGPWRVAFEAEGRTLTSSGP